jgi:hypothetical protein
VCWLVGVVFSLEISILACLVRLRMALARGSFARSGLSEMPEVTPLGSLMFPRVHVGSLVWAARRSHSCLTACSQPGLTHIVCVIPSGTDRGASSDIGVVCQHTVSLPR